MQIRASHSLLRSAMLLLALTTLSGLSGCGDPTQSTDWRNRELAWKYNLTNGTASPTHRKATGTDGPAPIAKGWKMFLVDGTKITVRPYQLATSHELFGQATMAVDLFDKQSQKIETLLSAPITADGTSFDFAVSEDIAKKTWDAIITFRKV